MLGRSSESPPPVRVEMVGIGVRSLQRKRKSRSVFNVLAWQIIKSLSAFYIASLGSQAICALHKYGLHHHIIPQLTLVIFGPVWLLITAAGPAGGRLNGASH